MRIQKKSASSLKLQLQFFDVSLFSFFLFFHLTYLTETKQMSVISRAVSPWYFYDLRVLNITQAGRRLYREAFYINNKYMDYKDTTSRILIPQSRRFTFQRFQQNPTIPIRRLDDWFGNDHELWEIQKTVAKSAVPEKGDMDVHLWGLRDAFVVLVDPKLKVIWSEYMSNKE